MATNSWQHLPQDPQFNKQRFKRKLLRCSFCVLVVMISIGVGWYFLRSIDSSVQRLEQIKFSSNGMLTEAWFRKTIPLPWKEQLLKVDLYKLQQEILRYSQVGAVEIMREFPSCIQVHIHEKQPCAKILLSQKGKRKLLLIASNGSLFSPIGYTKSILAVLPTVSGLHKDVLNQQKIVQFEVIAQFLKQLQTEAPDIYDRMSSLSLKHFDPALEEKWWILDLHLKGGLVATMPVMKASESFHKWKLIFKNLSQQQKTSLKKIDLSLSHPTLTF